MSNATYRASQQPHYLKHNQASRMPRKWAYIGTSSNIAEVSYGEHHTWMLGVGCFDDQRHRERGVETTSWETFDDPEIMCKWIDSLAEKRYRLIVVAYNLANSLRLMRSFDIFPALGWTLQRANLDSASAWVSWKRGDASISFIDILSWVPLGLFELGESVGLPIITRPREPGPSPAHEQAARRDVEILRASWRHIIDFIRQEDCGNWQPTGSGQAFATWRHRFLTDKILVGNEGGIRSIEREAAWTGRCEVWRPGHHESPGFWEWDLEMAYGHIGAYSSVPIRHLGWVHNWTLDKVADVVPDIAVLSRVKVTTEIPLVPMLKDGRITWPVGTFETVLWDPELLLLKHHGATVEMGETHVYESAPALRGFMEWAIAKALTTENAGDKIISKMVHQWTRALVGRLGMRYKSWEDWGEAPYSNCLLSPVIDTTTGESYRWLWIGKQMFRETELQEYPEGTPAIMSWIMSQVRVKLWDAMEQAGLNNVLYVDTDSVLVNAAGDKRLLKARHNGGVVGLRRKHKYVSLDLWAPRQIITNSTLRAAGVSKAAVKKDDGRYHTTVRRRLGQSIQLNEADRITVIRHAVTLHHEDKRRLHNDDGTTSPYRIG